MRITQAEFRRMTTARRGKWSRATPTTCAAGHRHASGMEARVCARLTLECRVTGARLLQQARFPLLAIGSKKTGKPETISVDFVLVPPSGPWRAIDAKNPTRVSRDWRLRTAAFEATYGRKVEETDR